MNKVILLMFLALLLPAKTFSYTTTGIDSNKLSVPEISYQELDSLITTHEFTAVYFWPTWCAPCVRHIPELTALLKTKTNISFYLINDADSRHNISKKLVADHETIDGYYRMEVLKPKNSAVRKFIQINDIEQIRLFSQHFTHQTSRTKNERSPAFLLFDETGKLIWYNQAAFNIEMVRDALKDFN